jgi:hypothetical protein
MTSRKKEKPGDIPSKADHWNYRMTVQGHGEDEVWTLREMYYDRKDKVLGWSEDPVPLLAESHAGIREELINFMDAGNRPAYDLNREVWVDPWAITLTVIEQAVDVTEAVT